MAKKNKTNGAQKLENAQVEENASKAQDNISEGVLSGQTSADVNVYADKKSQKQAAKEAKAAEKNAKKAEEEKKAQKNAKKQKKDKKEKKGIGKRTKETISELKKVTWPTFGEVVKKTGVVVAFVLIFAVFLFGVNYLLGGLVNLLVNGTWM